MEERESMTTQLETGRLVRLTEHKTIDMLGPLTVVSVTIHGPTHHRPDAHIIGRITHVGTAIHTIDISTQRL